MRVNYSLKQINNIVNGKLLGDPSALIESIVTDTRNYISTDHPIFIALQGKKSNGHQYLEDAYNKGIVNFIVSETPSHQFKKANYLIVDNTLETLQKWATFHRSKFNIPVIGITGSNGKTIIKEWIYLFLRDQYNIIRSPKSFNSQLGVPLSLLMINKEHDLAIIEAGISEPGEMQQLKNMINPTHDYEHYENQIVANKINSIDTDKFDYLLRDSISCGMNTNFHYTNSNRIRWYRRGSRRTY